VPLLRRDRPPHRGSRPVKRHPDSPMRHTRHGLDDLRGAANATTDDASSPSNDTSDDASHQVSPQVMTLVTLMTLRFPFPSIAHARTRTGRHTQLRVTSVIRHP